MSASLRLGPLGSSVGYGYIEHGEAVTASLLHRLRLFLLESFCAAPRCELKPLGWAAEEWALAEMLLAGGGIL